MKSVVIALIAMGFSGAALADGFVCSTADGIYTIRVYNEVNASEGTRNASIMVVSDNTIRAPRKTIAAFAADNNILDNEGARYVAKVDLRYSGSNRAGENLFGTKLGFVNAITLDVDFNYGTPVRAGADLTGKAIILKRNGYKTIAEMNCTRYLKN